MAVNPLRALWKAAGRRVYAAPVIGRAAHRVYGKMVGFNTVPPAQSAAVAAPDAPFLGALERLEGRFAEQERRLDSAVARIEQRFEFVRIEMMYELQHWLSDSAGPAAHKAERDGKVVNPGALERFGLGEYRLNLGCGHKPLDGWINVDLRPLPGVDITATADNVPLPPGSCAALTSAHLMEHFTEEDMLRRILPHWFGLLRPGGAVTCIVPDAGSMMRLWAEGGMDFETLRLITYGQQEYDGDFHFTMFTPASLGALLEKAGFVDVETLAEGRRNGLCLEFEIRASKPAV